MLTSSYGDDISDTILITLSNRRAADYNAAIRTEVLYREEEIMRDDMLIVSRNHYFGKKVGGIDFVANGDILTVEAVYGTEVAYGLRFADVRLSLPVPGSQAVEFDIKILLDSLASPEAGISQEAWNALYYGLMGDNGPYADRAVDAACGDYVVSLGQSFAEFAYFFLAFLLGTDHEEVEDGDKSHDHEDAGYSALGCLLKENSVGKHGFYFIIYILVFGY